MSDIMREIPPFLHEMLQKQYGAEAKKIEAGYACRRPVTLRVNTLKASAEEVAARLGGYGISVSPVPWYRDALIVEDAGVGALSKTDLYTNGEIYLQSLSSMLPPLLLSPGEGETVLDMAAAPGGKTAQISALSHGKALITACEKDKIRFDRLKFNLARQGVPRVSAICADAVSLDDFFRFDKILLDAPCSGSGTLGGGTPVRISEKLIASCTKTQSALLSKALRLLKKGGTLVYSTCSVLKQENEEAVDRALAREGGRLLPIAAPFVRELPLLPGREGTVTVCPDAMFEGFFLAVLTK